MKNNNIRTILVMFLCLALAGCATTTSRCGYMTGSVKEMHLKGLDSSQALDLFHRVYNMPVKDREDEIAKNITITAFMKALKSMHSGEIRNSGALKLQYDKINLRKWKSDDLMGIYRILKDRMIEDKDKSASSPKEKAEKENLEIIRLTALCSIGNEISRRDSAAGGWAVFGQALGAATTLAVQAATVLAGFMI